jgi:hypothetical protein
VYGGSARARRQVLGVAYGDDYGETAGRAMEAVVRQAVAEGFPPPNIWHSCRREELILDQSWKLTVSAVGRL